MRFPQGIGFCLHSRVGGQGSPGGGLKMIAEDIQIESSIAAVRQGSIPGGLFAWPECPGVWHAAVRTGTA